MNRKQRRAQTRTARRRNSSAPTSHQKCVLWVPDMMGYVFDFGPNRVMVVDDTMFAKHYSEDEASSAALAFRQVVGQRVAVRPLLASRAGN